MDGFFFHQLLTIYLISSSSDVQIKKLTPLQFANATVQSRMCSATWMKLWWNLQGLIFKTTAQNTVLDGTDRTDCACVCVCFLIFIFCGPRRPRRPRLRQPVGAEEVARFFFRTSVQESKQINNNVKAAESFEEPAEAAKPDIFHQTTTAVGNLIYFGSSKYWSWLLKKGIRKEGFISAELKSAPQKHDTYIYLLLGFFFGFLDGDMTVLYLVQLFQMAP